MNLSVGNVERKIAEYRRVKMSEFMEPELHDASLEPFGLVRNHGEDRYCPAWAIDRDHDLLLEFHDSGYFIRWNAPGYMDCTEWNGPYETEYDAYYDLWLQFDSDTIPFHQWLRKYGIDLELKEKGE